MCSCGLRATAWVEAHVPRQAIDHSVPVASFGDGIVIRRVDPGPADVVIGGKATDRSK